MRESTKAAGLIFSFFAATLSVVAADKGGVAGDGGVHALTTASVEPVAAVPVFHSRPGSANSLFIDFNSKPIAGTEWNAASGVSRYEPFPYSLDGDSGTWNSEEQGVIKETWERVSEDFAPFDIDVTTEEPTAGAGKQVRVVVSFGNTDRNQVVMPANDVDAAAYSDIFSKSDPAHFSPCFVYGWNFANSAAYLAAKVSHLAGHNFGLSHDALKGGFDRLDGWGDRAMFWTPIMGTGFPGNMSQWSKGDYVLATNKEDDVAILAAQLGYETATGGHQLEAALAVPQTGDEISAVGLIRKAGEPVYHTFSAAEGPLVLTVTPLRGAGETSGGNADLKLEFLANDGTVLATADPLNRADASITTVVQDGQYRVRVSGSAYGDPLASVPSGYSTYGSLGRYVLTAQLIGAKPAFTSSLSARVGAGHAFRYTLKANRNPKSVSVSALPEGLTYEPATGVIAGRVYSPGNYAIHLEASNFWGTTAETLALEVYDDVPAIVESTASRVVLHPGEASELSVNAYSADHAVTYTWYHNFKTVPDSNHPQLSLSTSQSDVGGWYQVYAENKKGITHGPLIFVKTSPRKTEVLDWLVSTDGAIVQPEGLNDVVSIAAGTDVAFALRADGSVVGWGRAGDPRLVVPSDLGEVVALSVAEKFVLALKADGTARAWGTDRRNETVIPDGLNELVVVAAAGANSYALKADGTCYYWGYPSDRGVAGVMDGGVQYVDLTAGGGDYGSTAALRTAGGVLRIVDLGYGVYLPYPTSPLSSVTMGEYFLAGVLGDGRFSSTGSLQNLIQNPSLYSDLDTVHAYGSFAFGIKKDRTGIAFNSTLPASIQARLHEVVTISGFAALRDSSGDTVPQILTPPVANTVKEGESFEFRVAASGGTSPVLYQWRRNGVAIAGAVQPVYSEVNAELADDAEFDCVMTSYAGTSVTTPVRLSVRPLSVVVNASARRQFLTAGQRLSLNVTASGSGELAYQWCKDTVPIPGATTPAFQIGSFTHDDEGVYSLRITDSVGVRRVLFWVMYSGTKTHFEYWGPEYSSFSMPSPEPSDIVAFSGGYLDGMFLRASGGIFDVLSNLAEHEPIPSGLGPVARVYRGGQRIAILEDGRAVIWDTHGTPVPRRLGNIIAITGIADYTVALQENGVVRGWGSANGFAGLDGLSGVRAICQGGMGTLVALMADGTTRQFGIPVLPSVATSGLRAVFPGGTLYYAVRNDGTVDEIGTDPDHRFTTRIPGSLKAPVDIVTTFASAFALTADGKITAWGNLEAGQLAVPEIPQEVYHLSNFGGIAAIRDASGDKLPSFTRQPVGVATGEGLPATFSVAVDKGAVKVGYQWRKGGVAIPGANGSSLTLERCSVYDEDQYDVVVSNYLGQVVSTPASLKVSKGPAIVASQNTRLIFSVGETVRLGVTATGTGALSYQWFHDNVAIAGAVSPTVSIPSVTLRDAGLYHVAVTDSVSTRIKLMNVQVAPAKTEVYTWGRENMRFGALGQPELAEGLVQIVGAGDAAFSLGRSGRVRRLNGSPHNPDVAGSLTNIGSLGSFGAVSRDGTAFDWLSNFIRSPLPARNWVAITTQMAPWMVISDDGTVSSWSFAGDPQDHTSLRRLVNVVALTSDSSSVQGTVLFADGTVRMYGEGSDTISQQLRDLKGVSQIANEYLLLGNGTLLKQVSDIGLVTVEHPAKFVKLFGANGSTLAIDELGHALALSGVDQANPAPSGLNRVYGAGCDWGSVSVLRDASQDREPNFLLQPSNVVVEDGGRAEFAVEVDDRSGLPTYQWKKNGVAISGASSARLVIDEIYPDDAGDYTVIVTNRYGSTTSQIATLSLATKPVVTTHSPYRSLVPAYSELRLSVEATGTGPLTFQWYTAGQPIAGATASTYLKPSMTLADAGVYHLVIRDSVARKDVLFYVGYQPKATTLHFSADSASYLARPPEASSAISLSLSAPAAQALCADGELLEWKNFGDNRVEDKVVAKRLINGSKVVALSGGDRFAVLLEDGRCYRSRGPLVPGGSEMEWVADHAISIASQAGLLLVLGEDGRIAFSDVAPPSRLRNLDTVHVSGNGLPFAGKWDGKWTGWGDVSSHLVESYGPLSGLAYGWAKNKVLTPEGFLKFEQFSAALGRFSRILGSGDCFIAVRPSGTTVALECDSIPEILRSRTVSSIASHQGLVAWLEDQSVPAMPVFIRQPATILRTTGGTVEFSAEAAGEGLRYQWYKDGKEIAGANAPTYSVTGIQSSDAGSYVVTVANDSATIESRSASLVLGSQPPGNLLNMSIRSARGESDDPLIVGFVSRGGPCDVLIRAVGPGLVPFGVLNPVQDPSLVVHNSTSGGDVIEVINSDWTDGGLEAPMSRAFASVGAFPLPAGGSPDAAAVLQIDGARTVHVLSTGFVKKGVVLVETYDLAAGNSGRLINVSARAISKSGDDVMIAGFVIGAGGPKSLLIRAVGPTLSAAPFGIAGTMSDPMIELHQSIAGQDTVLAVNDNWSDEYGAEAAAAAAGAFALQKGYADAVIVTTLLPGNYTAVLRGAYGSAGDALLEVYELE